MVSEGKGFHPFEVTAPHLVYVGLGFFIVIFGMLSLFIKERLYLGEAPIAAIFGVIVGPVALSLFDPSDWGGSASKTPGDRVTNEITLELMRVTIALSVFAVGVELPKKYLLRHWRSIAMLLGPVMIWGWMITASLIYALVPGLDFLNSMVVAAAVTPTDPILAQAVVGGPWAEKHVPAHLRHMLMCESGCNDGAAFPFLYLALYLTTNRNNRGKAIAKWFYDAWAYEIILGTLLGALIGWAARKAMRFSERHKLVDRESFVAQYVSLAIASMGVNVLLGSDDLLAAFACGTAFAWDGWFTRQTEDSNFSNIIDLLFNVAAFIYIGALLPFHDFNNGALGLHFWRLLVIGITVLLLKRIPVVIALWRWIPDIKTFREAAFAGWFGPIGVGAIFIATLARTQLPEEVPEVPETSNDYLALTIQPIIYFLVMCSILVHGLTIPFFAFSRRAHTITRTWSRHASFGVGDGDEPGWMSRIRKFRTDDSAVQMEEGNMTEIQRVLNAQLGVIGRGAIGGDAEKELRGEETTDSAGSGGEGGPAGSAGSSTDSTQLASNRAVGLINTRTERGMEAAEREAEGEYDGDDFDLPREDPSCEWGGDDTAEARRFREKQLERESARKLQEERRADEGDEGDISEAPMDRDLHVGRVHEDEGVREDEERAGREEKGKGSSAVDEEEERHHKMTAEEEGAATCGDHTKYPMVRSWVEGHKLVIEILEHKSSDPEVHIMCLTDADKESISESESPAHAWVQAHLNGIEEHLGLKEHRSWTAEEAPQKLLHHNIPAMYSRYVQRITNRRASTSDEGGGPAPRAQSPEGASPSPGRQARRRKAAEQAGHDAVDTQDDRDRRADLLYGPAAWAREESAEQQEARQGRRSRAQSEELGDMSEEGEMATLRNSSTSPRRGSFAGALPRAPVVHSARPTMGGRRSSMRKRVLAGKLRLSGRKGGRGDYDEDEDEQLVEEEERGFPVTGGGFARTSSLGGLGGPPGPSLLQQRPGTSGASSSVQWLDSSDTMHDRTPREMLRHNGANNHASGVGGGGNSSVPSVRRFVVGEVSGAGSASNSRSGSRNPSPTRKEGATTGIPLERTESMGLQSPYRNNGGGNGGGGLHRTTSREGFGASGDRSARSRIANMFSNAFGGGSGSGGGGGGSGNAATSSSSSQQQQQPQRSQTEASGIEGHHAPPSRSASAPLEAVHGFTGGDGGILAPPGSSTGNNANAKDDGDDNKGGVTFDLPTIP